MSVVINTNYAAVLARKNLAEVQRQMDRSVERLSSGKRINNAADDAAGSAIAGRMESQIRGLTMGIRHAKDGQSLVGTSEGAMQEINKMLQRMRELAIQAASGVANSVDKDYLNLEMGQLVSQVEAISANTKFNDQQLLKGGRFTFYTDIDVELLSGNSKIVNDGGVMKDKITVFKSTIDSKEQEDSASQSMVIAPVSSTNNSGNVYSSTSQIVGLDVNGKNAAVDALENLSKVG